MARNQNREVWLCRVEARVWCGAPLDRGEDIQIKCIRSMIELYTDGAAQGNPGPGGYGAILRYGTHEKELSQGYRLTTNNRMELLAVIAGLEAILKPGIPVKIISDSKYVVDSVEKGWIWG